MQLFGDSLRNLPFPGRPLIFRRQEIARFLRDRDSLGGVVVQAQRLGQNDEHAGILVFRAGHGTAGDYQCPRRVAESWVADIQEEIGAAGEHGGDGLGAVPVIAGCTHDTAAAVAAFPAQGNHWAYLSSGTWSLIGVELDAPLINDAARAASFTNEVGYGGTIRFLKNIIGLWLLQECRRVWAREGRDFDYAALTQLAADAPPLRSLIHPDDPRFHAPGDMPAAIRAFCRETAQPEPDTPGEYARCISESLARLYGAKLGELEQLTDRTLRSQHIVGGGAKNGLLNQLAANATGRSVLAGPIEATALGNVLSQALGELPNLESARAVVRQSFAVTRYDPQESATWQAARERFAALS